MNKQMIIRSIVRRSPWLVGALACLVAVMCYAAKSERITCSKSGSEIIVMVDAPQNGCWLQVGFSMEGGKIESYARPLRAGVNEGIKYDIPQGAKACMLNLYAGVNRNGECPSEKAGRQCPVKPMTRDIFCFCAVSRLDSLGWVMLREE